MHLIDGRRVVVRDLLDAGILKPGESLRFTRPRMGASFQAEVTTQGRLRLDSGEEFQSPSRAAMVAANMRAVDGWHTWIVESTGQSLDVLRQEVLDSALAGSATGSPEVAADGSALRVHEWLRNMRRRAEAHDPETISVRDLLSLWGARDRGDQIAGIEADLANHGLATRPSFRSVTLDATVQLITAAQDADQESEEAEEVGVGTGADADEAEPRHVWLTVGNLPSALGGIASVSPTASVDEAMTKMLLNDYSQLAVMSTPHHLRGAITWQSISHARHHNPSAGLADATVDATAVPYHTDLFEVLEHLRRVGFIFVRNENNMIAGIVTTSDVVARYEETANPFILIGDLDRALRRAIARRVSLDEVSAICDPRGSRITGFHDMSMGDYQRVLENPGCWERLGWPLDRKVFVERLTAIRKIRNSVMHFNPDPLPSDTVFLLRTINAVLRTYAG